MMGRLFPRTASKALPMTRLGTITVVVLLLVGLLPTIALAHHPILSVEGECNPETLQWDITWTVANGDWSGRGVTLTAVSYTDPGMLSSIVVGLDLAASESVSETVSYPMSHGSNLLSFRVKVPLW